MTKSENVQPTLVTATEEQLDVSRRGFLGGVGAVAAVAAVGGGLTLSEGTASAAAVGPLTPSKRRKASYDFREDAAKFWRQRPDVAHPCNGDETLYPNKIGSYSKALPHNAFGEVDLPAFASFINALTTGEPADFEAIQLGLGRKLTNPQAGLAFDLEGADAHALVIPPAPALASAEIAGEQIEHYWQALLRDVSFDDYATHPDAGAAATELTSLGANFKGPKQAGAVTRRSLFRDVAPGTLQGNYISQFMLMNTPFGTEYIERRQRTLLAGTDKMTTVGNWLNIQNGGTPVETEDFDPTRRYIRNGRDLSQWVHIDVLFQAYFNACLIMLTPPSTDPLSGGLGVPLNAGNPYNSSATQLGFGTFGPPGIKALLCEVASRCLKAVWYQKWFVHRRLRPEVYGGRVHFQKTANRYPGILHPSVLGSTALARTFANTGTYLLPQAFPEGSPTHGSYGAGHATVAGACVTILKALFDANTVIASPVEVDPSSNGTALRPYSGSDTLTVEGELNKLASNVATGRNIAGVHWRSDAFWSLRLGQAVAISILRDQRNGYNENFAGYTFRGFDGETITV